MTVATERGEDGFVPTLFIRDSGEHDPPPVSTALTVVVLGRDLDERLLLSTRLGDLPGMRRGPVAAEDSCDWCYSSATASSLAASERLGLVAEDAYCCDVCLATEEFRKSPPGGWNEDVQWPFLATT